jgi:4-hydroxy-2-oxoheptanedioate aldolase
MQYLLNRKQILDKGTVAPVVTPIVRIPANGAEKSQWLAKQALDRGVYGVIFPHISTADQAYSAVAACRYPRQKSANTTSRKVCAATDRIPAAAIGA